MAFIPVPTVASVRLVGRIDGQTTNNTLYFASENPPITLDQLQALADAIGNWYTTTVLTFLSNSYTFEIAYARDLTTQAGFQTYNNVGGGGGGIGGAFAPNNVAPVVTFRSAIAGRSGRGRNYVPAVPMTAIDGNRLESFWMTDIQAAYASILPDGSLKPEGWTWVVVSRYEGGAPRPAGVASAVIQCGFTDDVVDSQRRRLPGRGA